MIFCCWHLNRIYLCRHQYQMHLWYLNVCIMISIPFIFLNLNLNLVKQLAFNWTSFEHSLYYKGRDCTWLVDNLHLIYILLIFDFVLHVCIVNVWNNISLFLIVLFYTYFFFYIQFTNCVLYKLCFMFDTLIGL